jgi:hypothetical protein
MSTIFKDKKHAAKNSSKSSNQIKKFKSIFTTDKFMTDNTKTKQIIKRKKKIKILIIKNPINVFIIKPLNNN